MSTTIRFASMLGFALLAGLQAGSAEQRNANHPNIIVIMADDLGFGDLSCYGAKTFATPNLDQLAKDGIRFTSAHSAASTCTPTRFALLTGSYAFRHPNTGIAPPNSPLIIKPETMTLPRILKQAGYATAVIGKWHLGLGINQPDWNGDLKPGPLELGFDHCLIMPTTNDRVPQVLVENHRVRNLDPADPMWVGDKAPSPDHITGLSHRQTLRMDWNVGHNGTIHNGISRIGYYTGGTKARFRDEDLADEWVTASNKWIEQHKDKPFFLFYAAHDLHVPRMPHERFQGKTPHGFRGDAIIELDWTVGEIMKTLDRLNLANNTLIIFCSDNGPVLDDGYKDSAVEKLGEHQPAGIYRGTKGTVFEGGTRTPMIARWKGKIKPAVSDQLLCSIDFARSFAHLTNQQVPKHAFGDSFNMMPELLGMARDQSAGKARDHFISQENSGNRLGFRVGDWKLIRNRPSGNPPAVAKKKRAGQAGPMLFNLKDDPKESTNLVNQEPARAKQLSEMFDKVISTPESIHALSSEAK